MLALLGSAVILPLIVGLFLRLSPFRFRNPWMPGFITSLTIFFSFWRVAIAAWNLNPHQKWIAPLWTWFEVGNFHFQFGIQFDSLSAIMALMVTGVGFLIMVYAMAYMLEDKDSQRFFAYMNLFVFFMLVLVLSDSFLGLLVGWEGVGLCSYLLIGFWYQNEAYNQAAKKAFVMNRIGDAGLILAMMILWICFASLNYQVVLNPMMLGVLSPGVLTALALCLFLGAVGKSAQVPLLTWLPDAMAGPTPVSALIHAATMVTAGIYLVARSSLIFSMSPHALTIVMVTGCLTALVGAGIALVQNDIKKVLAYSTVSQLGIMVAALGMGAYSAALFHMVMHAFFKALLFLGAGSVIHACNGEQNILRMGGLRKHVPITAVTFAIGALAIAGCPPLAGFFSKDAILLTAFNSHPWVAGVVCGVSILTAVYMARLYMMVFEGKSRYHGHPHESPAAMTVPLISLAVLSVLGGWIPVPFFAKFCVDDLVKVPHEGYLGQILLASTLVLLVAIIGWGYRLYASKENLPLENDTLFLKKCLSQHLYIDAFYESVIIRPLRWAFSRMSDHVDPFLDRGVKAPAQVVMGVGGWMHRKLTGAVTVYILVFAWAVLAVLAYTFWDLLC